MDPLECQSPTGRKLAAAMDARAKGNGKELAESGRFVGMAPARPADGELASTRYKKMVESVVKEPPLYMLKFGKLWSQDALAFHHNAMRRELQDMYYLIASMSRRVLDLAHEDIDDFYEWFDLFEVFTKDFFALEDEVLFPWLESKVPVDELTALSVPRAARKDQTQAALRNIDDCQARFANLPAGEVLPILVRALDQFAPAIVTYMAESEREVLPIIARHFTSVDKARYDRSLLAWVKESPNAFLLWHLLIRPVSKSSGEHAALRRRFITSETGLFARLRMKRYYRLSQREVRDSHYGIVLQFYRRWGRAAVDAIHDEISPKSKESAAHADSKLLPDGASRPAAPRRHVAPETSGAATPATETCTESTEPADTGEELAGLDTVSTADGFDETSSRRLLGRSATEDPTSGVRVPEAAGPAPMSSDDVPDWSGLVDRPKQGQS